MSPASRVLDVEGPLDLQRTMGHLAMWGGTTWLRADPDACWYARRTEDGPGTVRIEHRGDEVHAKAWGPGADHLLDDVPGLVGLHDPGFASFEAHHDVVYELQRRHPGVRIGRTVQIFPRLVSTALAQKVTGKNGKRAVHAITRAWGEPAPGPHPELMLLPEPRELARRPYYDFHPLGIEKHRADLLKRIASRASALERAGQMDFLAAAAHLQKLPGIGPWTAGIVVGAALGDPDAVPVGDYHLPNVVAYNLAGEPRADDARMLELLAPYAGHRGRVVRMVKVGGRAAPKYGPRTAVRDLRRFD